MTKLQEAKKLAKRRIGIFDDATEHYYVAGDLRKNVFVVLQVSKESLGRGIWPLGFPGRTKKDRVCILIDITPKEFTTLKRKLRNGVCPKGWRKEWKIGQLLATNKEKKG